MELYHHGIKGQQWGKRNGPPYPLKNHSMLADTIARKAKNNVERITSDVKDAITNSGSKMYGLEHRLKTRDSIDRKIETDSKEKGITQFKAAQDIKDAVRFTSLARDDDFVRNYISTKSNLENKGYTEVRCRNYWDSYAKGKAKHKQITCVYKTPDGYLFEIQFHTPESQKAKDKKTPLYERRRTPGLSSDEQKRLEAQMDKLAESVPNPKGIYRIQSHD